MFNFRWWNKKIIKDVYLNKNYLLDPHGAVGYLGLQKYLQQHQGIEGIFLETAHPVKFYDVVVPVLQEAVAIPLEITNLLKKEKQSIKMNIEYDDLKEYLISKN